MLRIILFGSLAALLLILLRVSWFYFMINSYNPELFILFCGLIFLSLGGLIVVFWRKLIGTKNHRHILINSLGNIGEIISQYELSNTEKEVLELLAKGLSNAEIAEQRHVSLNTIKTHVSNIYRKIGISRRAELIALFHAKQSHPSL